MRILTLIVLLVANGYSSTPSQDAILRPYLLPSISAFFSYDAAGTQALPAGAKCFAVRTLLSTFETLKIDFRTDDLFSSYLKAEEAKYQSNTLLKIVFETYIKLLPLRDKLTEILTKLNASGPMSPVKQSRKKRQTHYSDPVARQAAAGHEPPQRAEFGTGIVPPQTQRPGLPKKLQMRRQPIQPVISDASAAQAMSVTQSFDLSYFRGNSMARLTLDLLNEIVNKGVDAEDTVLEVQGFQPNAEGVITLDSFAKKVSFPDTKADAREALFYNLKLTMNALKMHLHANLIGQDLAIDGFVNGLFDHYKSQLLQDATNLLMEVKTYKFAEILGEKRRPTCILILGPSGTGKTEMFNLAMRFLGMPYGTGSGADLTKPGYVGGKPDGILKGLITSAGDNLSQAEQRGGILIDEVDKLAVNGDGSLREFALGAQHSLLTFIEGSQPIQVEIGMLKTKVSFKTDRLLIVMAGAFSRLLPDVAEEHEAPLRDSDLISYGLCRELVNRVHTIVRTRPFETRHFMKIMSFQHSPLFQVLQDFSDRGVQIGIEPAALEVFAEFSQKQGFGARNLGRQLLSIVEFAREQAEVLLRGRAQILGEKKSRLEKLVAEEVANPLETRQATIARVTASILEIEKAAPIQVTGSSFTVTAQHVSDFIGMNEKKEPIPSYFM